MWALTWLTTQSKRCCDSKSIEVVSKEVGRGIGAINCSYRVDRLDHSISRHLRLTLIEVDGVDRLSFASATTLHCSEVAGASVQYGKR